MSEPVKEPVKEHVKEPVKEPVPEGKVVDEPKTYSELVEQLEKMYTTIVELNKKYDVQNKEIKKDEFTY